MKWKTSISCIKDGKEIVRGHDLQELIATKSFVEVACLILRGVLPKENETKMLNALFVSAIDHGVGAPSTTVARTVASCGNSMHTALASGVLAMGERHGGAIEGAAKFFQENTQEEERKEMRNRDNDAAILVAKLKEEKVRIPGYGHKVLVRDLRAEKLLAIAKDLGVYASCCVFAEEVERELNKISSKPLPLNIDGAMAAILSDMGFDWRMMKGLFVIARMPGLVAHAYEELTNDEGVRRIDEGEVEYQGG